MQGDNGKVVCYDGFDESLAFIKDYIALHGPFDGLWAFSQACHDLQSLLKISEGPYDIDAATTRHLSTLFGEKSFACIPRPPEADAVV